jgi:hypothetical protein
MFLDKETYRENWHVSMRGPAAELLNDGTVNSHAATGQSVMSRSPGYLPKHICSSLSELFFMLFVVLW